MDSAVLKSLKIFHDDFAQSDVRKQAGRAMRQSTVEDAHSDAASTHYLMAKLRPLCPKGTIGVKSLKNAADDSPLKNALHLCNFAVKQGSHHAYVDKGKLWSIRVATEGARVVAVASFQHVVDFMKAKKHHPGFSRDLLQGQADGERHGVRVEVLLAS